MTGTGMTGSAITGTGTPAEWYIAREGAQHGPLSDIEIRKFVDLGHLRLSPGMYSFQLAVGTGNELLGHIDFDLISEVLPFEVAAIDGDGGMLGAWHPSWGSIRFLEAKLAASSSNRDG